MVRPETTSAAVLATIRRGDALMLSGEHEAAARAFVQALETLKGRASELTVDVYLRLGRANRALNRVTACMHCYKSGLEADPEHAPTLRALAELHLEWNEYQACENAETRLFQYAGSAKERTLELIRSGDRWWKRAQLPAQAELRYRQALDHATEAGLALERERVLARLRAISTPSATTRLRLVPRSTTREPSVDDDDVDPHRQRTLTPRQAAQR